MQVFKISSSPLCSPYTTSSFGSAEAWMRQAVLGTSQMLKKDSCLKVLPSENLCHFQSPKMVVLPDDCSPVPLEGHRISFYFSIHKCLVIVDFIPSQGYVRGKNILTDARAFWIVRKHSFQIGGWERVLYRVADLCQWLVWEENIIFRFLVQSCSINSPTLVRGHVPYGPPVRFLGPLANIIRIA